MDVKVTYKGREVSVEIPDAKLEELVAEKKRTGYEREETYWLQDTDGQVIQYGHKEPYDERVYFTANYYTDERLARDNDRADTLMRKLRRYAAEHGGIPSRKDWRDTGTCKYCIVRDGLSTAQKLRMCQVHFAQSVGQVYFLSEEACEAAIKEFHDELKWYFTEYDPQLR